jgi:hypothetical protein
MNMPFGKFKGVPVDELPQDYLNWLWTGIDLREPLRSAVARVLFPECGPVDEPAIPDKDIVRHVYRRLAYRWHPDHGGSTEAMQAINQFYTELIAGIRQ